jgi:hypothetical protein
MSTVSPFRPRLPIKVSVDLSQQRSNPSSVDNTTDVLSKDAALSPTSPEQQRIMELEAEVSRLTGKTSSLGMYFALFPSENITLCWRIRSVQLTDKNALVDKLADYEEEISTLKKNQIIAVDVTARPSSASSSNLSPQQQSPPPVQQQSAPSRLTSFLTRKPSIPTPSSLLPSSLTSTPTDSDSLELQKQLATEIQARKAAESSLTSLKSEIDDLSVQLFSQANEMVANERRARDRLEKRVAELEQRDREKVKRLERIEGAVNRIERVRGLLR